MTDAADSKPSSADKASKGAQQTADTASQFTDKLVRDTVDAAHKASTPEGRDEAASQAKDAGAKLADRAKSTADDVRRRAGDASHAARDWAADQSDVLRDTVQTKPFISIGVSAASAFAAGLILGVLLARD